jgi:hypothetical protein
MLLQLPAELLFHIATFLDLEDYLLLTSVCRTLAKSLSRQELCNGWLLLTKKKICKEDSDKIVKMNSHLKFLLRRPAVYASANPQSVFQLYGAKNLAQLHEDVFYEDGYGPTVRFLEPHGAIRAGMSSGVTQVLDNILRNPEAWPRCLVHNIVYLLYAKADLADLSERAKARLTRELKGKTLKEGLLTWLDGDTYDPIEGKKVRGMIFAICDKTSTTI